MLPVIKTLGIKAPAGAGKLYRDCLVKSGTLFLIDFSNTGTLDNFSVIDKANVYDLADDSAKEFGILSGGTVRTLANLTLTPGRGFSTSTNSLPAGGNQGVLFSCDTLMSYLATKQPNSLFVCWVRRDVTVPSNGSTQIIRTIVGAANVSKNLRLNLSTVSVGGSFGGADIAFNSFSAPAGDLIQFGIEFQGVNKPLRTYLNGQALSIGPNAPGFNAADKLGIGKIEDLKNGNGTEPISTQGAIYRMLIEDLSVTGRSALEVMQKDWCYVTATRQHTGIVKRPFVNEY